MTNKEFIRFIMTQNPNMYRNDIHKILQFVWKAMREALSTGESILIPGVGSIYSEFVEEKKRWKSPFTGEVKDLPAKIRLCFRSSKRMRRRLNEELLGAFDESSEDEKDEVEESEE